MENDKSEVSALVEIITVELREHDKRIADLEKNDVEKTVKIDHLTKALDKIDSNTTWTYRLVLGGVVGGALGLLFALVKSGLIG